MRHRRSRGATDRLGMRKLHPARRRNIRLKKLEEQHYKCAWCGCPLTTKTATVDHLIECSNGGTNEESNLVVACAECNNRRSNSGESFLSLGD